MPNFKKSNDDNMSIGKSFTAALKKDDVKVICKIKLNGEKAYEKRRIISKILKLDENNRYGFAMTKPIPAGCIKEHPSSSWKKNNLLIESITLDDKIGHLFVVDIEFDKKTATERELL